MATALQDLVVPKLRAIYGANLGDKDLMGKWAADNGLNLGNTDQMYEFYRARSTGLVLPTTGGPSFSSPDSAALSLSGDCEIRAKCRGSWQSADYLPIFNKWSSVASYWFGLHIVLPNALTWIAINNAGTSFIYTSPALPAAMLQLRDAWVRMTYDIDNGSSQSVATFYYSLDETNDPNAVNWTLIGTAVQGLPTQIRDTTDLQLIGLFNGGGPVISNQMIYVVQVRNSIGGTVVASPDFTLKANTGVDSFADPQGNVWSRGGSASIGLRLGNAYKDIVNQYWDSF